MDELLPCPFCGGAAHFFATSHDSDEQVQVQCRSCGAEIAHWCPWTMSEAEKIAAKSDVFQRWNTRAPTTQETP